MKKELDWRVVDRRELAELLGAAPDVASRAVGAATVYRIEEDGRAALAIALPDGQAVVVTPAAPTTRKRRRVDNREINPASR